MSKTVSGRVSGNSGVSEKVSGTFCVFSKKVSNLKNSVSNSVLSVLKVSRRGLRPLVDSFRKLNTLFETLFSLSALFGVKSQNVLDTFSDTPELPDTLPDTVLVTF